MNQTPDYLFKQTWVLFADAILSLDKSTVLSIWLGDGKVDLQPSIHDLCGALMQFLTALLSTNHSTETSHVDFLKNPKSIVAVCQFSDTLPVVHDAEQR